MDATSATYEDVENAIKKTGKVIKSGKIVQPAIDVAPAKPVETPQGAESSKVVA